MNEVDRIKDVYARRDASGKRAMYSDFDPAALYIIQRRQVELIGLLKRSGLYDLSDMEILEVGCGDGRVLREFIGYGADPARCHGLDLLPFRIEEARRLSPNIDFRCLNAETLPFEDGTCDMALAFTVFSSILDTAMKENLAGQMVRVLRPGGTIIFYDYHANNPRNRDARGIRKREIAGLFGGCEISLRKVTLAPPLVRALAPVSRVACELLEKLPFLRTHYLGAIRKR